MDTLSGLVPDTARRDATLARHNSPRLRRKPPEYKSGAENRIIRSIGIVLKTLMSLKSLRTLKTLKPLTSLTTLTTLTTLRSLMSLRTLTPISHCKQHKKHRPAIEKTDGVCIIRDTGREIPIKQQYKTHIPRLKMADGVCIIRKAGREIPISNIIQNPRPPRQYGIPSAIRSKSPVRPPTGRRQDALTLKFWKISHPCICR